MMLSARMEEKKTEALDTKSQGSYRSTHSTRSSVLERAREYNRRIEQQQRRTKSLERGGVDGNVNDVRNGENMSDAGSSKASSSRRSVSAGRDNGRVHGHRPSTRERALASVRKESAVSTRVASQTTEQTQPLTPASSAQYSNRQHHTHSASAQNHRPVITPSQQQQQQQHQQQNGRHTNPTLSNTKRVTNPSSPSVKASPRSLKSSAPPDEEAGGVVTPELLVDALSGHEDGLLAIAERLMEHYEGGYDVMGEAIIDAFADVQKLFQHVVEAAHMEGAAFEASRREEEINDLRKRAAGVEVPPDPIAGDGGQIASASPVGRHDEFIDQDVKDVLTEAIRKGSALRDANKFNECFELYEHACQAASSLLPVDSDHRGRLQLSIARAESMNADRACAILRYAMDDVLRSGMRAVRTPLPDSGKRADVVLSRPKAHPGILSVTGQVGVIQSSDEALASLMEEMKEVMSAPMFQDTPLQDVARRFWTALNESLKAQQKNEERLEQQLAKLKGDYLLAKAEWEEKLNNSNESLEIYKDKYERLKQVRGDNQDHNRFSSRTDDEHDVSMYGSVRSVASGKASSVASIGSGLAQQAKTIVNSMNQFNCNALNDRNGGSVDEDVREVDTQYDSRSRRGRNGHDPPRSATSASSAARKANRSFRDYSRSPQHVDV